MRRLKYLYGLSKSETDLIFRPQIRLDALFNFALKDLSVIRNTHSGMILANFILPMAFRVEKDKMGAKGDFAVPLMELVVLDIERKALLNAIVNQIINVDSGR